MAVNVKMGKELNEDTGFTISVKTLIAIGFAISTIIGMWFALHHFDHHNFHHYYNHLYI